MKELAVTDLDRDQLLELIDLKLPFFKVAQRDLYLALYLVTSRRVVAALGKVSAHGDTMVAAAKALDQATASGNRKAYVAALNRYEAARDVEERLEKAWRRLRRRADEYHAHLEACE